MLALIRYNAERDIFETCNSGFDDIKDLPKVEVQFGYGDVRIQRYQIAGALRVCFIHMDNAIPVGASCDDVPCDPTKLIASLQFTNKESLEAAIRSLQTAADNWVE
jgi:hypothetical protein